MADSIPRNLTRPVHVGNVTIGGGAPVVVQSMTCTPTVDLGATLEQVTKLAEAGCDVVRVSVPTKEALESFRDICRESPVPLVADIHFDYRLALGALDAGAAKLRCLFGRGLHRLPVHQRPGPARRVRAEPALHLGRTGITL